MGRDFTDRFSLLHFAVGIVASFWNISFLTVMVLHTVFEWAENTNLGMNIINEYITVWPGGKPSPDTLLNNVGDTVYTALGWGFARWISKTFPD